MQLAADRGELLEPEPSSAEARVQPRLRPLATTLAVVALALVPRLVYLFLFTDPQNAGDGMTDTYHHWQIGYLTQQIGISHGLRLWDLKGVEYFWGLLHPVILLIAFTLTQSVDIIVPRLVSIAFGTLTVVLLFHLGRRYWGNEVAWSVTLFAALAPPIVFNDALGMVEPVAIALVLLGFYAWPARGFLTGVAWSLAAMARTEAWLFTGGLVVAARFRRVSFERWFPLLIGWALPMAIYMKFLLDRTGNPIYPLYWEFLVEGTGRWLDPSVGTQARAVQPLFVGLLLLSMVGAGLTVWKRPPSFLLLSYGFGSTAFVMGLLSFTPFISTWSDWVWRIRILSFSFDFAALLALVALFVLLRAVIGGLPRLAPWVLVLFALAALQLTWLPIQAAYWKTETTWQSDLKLGRNLAALYQQPQYRWGILNIPADQPTLTYTLVSAGGVRGTQIVGQLYDPFYSEPAGFRYDQHSVMMGKLMACWFNSTNTSVFVVPESNSNDMALLADHGDWFNQIERIPDRGWLIEAIRSQAVVASACRR